MRWDDFRSSDNVEDRRGDGGGGGGFQMPGGRGGLGIGTIIIVGIVGWALGINPAVLIGGLEAINGMGGGSAPQQQAAPRTAPQGAPKDELGRFAAAVLAQTEDVWTELFRAEGKTYQDPKLVLFSGATRSACGGAQSAMGPFYCPLDQKVYLDLSFFQEMKTRFKAPGDFAAAYVIAHEVGHHVENLIGILPKVQQAQARATSRAEANNLSVRVELMADCLAGVWAYHANARFRILEQGDVEEALNAATAIGDDKLQKQSQGYAVPDSFTHGSSQQRVNWFTRGLKGGSMQQCNTFSGPI
ncbi:neutral zinc metallopeptidase [Xanthobacter oligotrophicus]|uniref:KPN_02809 family neutral zinc metallopeptidase n=1 Tax=Xanthobacter oligotrophicus TaxID=2607286 RepID=UPI0011F0E678|nr:neutral zinc metallopeptidase [Xanthobacter oligotrophicus]MCG5236948.1 zinc metallopeptidase [Xanthobacter oligotrophicus]